ncbi:MAG: substrate-binding domain-containing protein [Phycisphaerales bacterium]
MKTPSLIRMLVAPPHDPAFAYEFCQGVARYKAKGRPWLIHTVSFDTLRRNPDWAKYDECQAAILVGGWETHAISITLDQLGIKVVQVWNPNIPDDFPAHRIGRVELDDYRIGQMGAEHLMAQGFDRLAFFGWSAGWCMDRQRGFVETVRKAGRQCQEWIVPPDAEWKDIAYGGFVEQRLDRCERPIAVMAFGDDGARRVLELCLARRWTVPADVAVLGVDDLFFMGDCLPITLSSIQFNRQRMGYQAAALMDKMLLGSRPPAKPIFIPPKQVVVRQSTHRVEFADPDIARAVAFIRTHATDNIGVEDVLEILDVSRSTFERRFESAVGHSAAVEIRKARIEVARRMLIETDMPLVEIAVACGFSSIAYLSHSFRQWFDMPPARYRQIFTGR